MNGSRILGCFRYAARWLKLRRFRRDLEAEGLHLVAEVTLPESLQALNDPALETGPAHPRWSFGPPRTLRDEEPVRRAERPGDPQRNRGPAEARSRWHPRPNSA
jgi:hypothetical protein